MISFAGKGVLVLAFLQLLCLREILSGTIKESLRDYEDLDYLAGETLHRVGTCDNNKTLVEIRFDSDNPPVTLITLCHDEDLDFTLWAKSYIFGEDLENSEGGGNRPSFKEGDFIQRFQRTIAISKLPKRKQLNACGLNLIGTTLCPNFEKLIFVERSPNPKWRPHYCCSESSYVLFY
ncbi:hypothetical protein Ocin01_15042 [Orchesella cincta]|uniref:Uncharacterized protein n=1 Tax=Orchesella cincta TaxID=48709 RepID=A0A1D2MF56_ORCCI|nr:hypothetical protein Ocin01_15042 [Orchesella cincta]